MSFFQALARRSIANPRFTLALAAVVTLAALPGMFQLKLRTDGHALVDANAPEVNYDRQIRDAFGIEDQIVVLIRSPHTNGIFNPATLQLVRDLTADLTRLPSPQPGRIMSLATEPSFRIIPGTMHHEKLLDPPLKAAGELNQLRDDLRRIQLYTGTLVSVDGQCTAILLGTPPGINRTKLYQQVRQVIAARSPGADDIAVTGAPAAESLLGLHILEDLGVPKAFLGGTTPSHAEEASWKWPVNFTDLKRPLAQRVGLVPVTVLVMLAIFFLSFRSLTATLLPLPEVAATMAVTFGLMGWLGVPVYLTVAVMPVLLTAMCVTDEIHIFNRYFTLLREQPDAPHVRLVEATMDEMICPVVNTTLTTAIGFISFAFSPLAPVQAFGLFTGVGVLFSLFYSVSVIPAMLVLINPARLVPRREPGSNRAANALGTAFGRWALGVVRHRWWVAATLAILLAVTPLGLRRLIVQDSWIDGFNPESDFHRATELVNRHFYGMHLLLVSAEAPALISGELPATALSQSQMVLPMDRFKDAGLIAGSSVKLSLASASNTWTTHVEMTAVQGSEIYARIGGGGLGTEFMSAAQAAGRVRYEIVLRNHFRPGLIRDLGGLADFIRERRPLAVGGVLGPQDYLETTRFMARPNDPDARRLPADTTETKLLWDYYALARGPARLRQVVDSNYWESLTTVFLKNANFQDTARLMADIRQYERQHLSPRGIKLGFAGDVAVSQSLISDIVTTQLRSLCWSLLGICVVTAVLGHSWRRGLYSVLPSALAVAFNFAVMGWLDIPLGVATSMFAGMTLGIGVDFAIHLIEGFESARAGGAAQGQALSRAMALSGPAVLINTVALACGFGVLMFSQVPANARLGFLTVLGLVDCLVVTLLILPVVLHWWPLGTLRKSATRPK